MRNKDDYSVSHSYNDKPSQSVDVNYEEYDDSTKKTSFFSRLFVWSKDSSNENLDEEDFSDVDEFNVEVQDVDEAVHEYEELDDQERMIEKKKSSIFAWLFKKKTNKINESDFADGVEVYDEKRDSEEIALLKEDLKKLGIICYDLIKMLDEPEFKRFKLSDDFIEYKGILKKHNLVRTKY